MRVFSRRQNSHVRATRAGRLVRLSSLSALIVLVSACGSSAAASSSSSSGSSAGKSTTTTVATSNINVACDTGFFSCTPLLVANQEGFFAKNHLHATFIPISSSTAGEAGLVSGSIDIGLGPDPFVIQSKAGIHVEAVTGLTTEYFLILANSSMPTPANESPAQIMQSLRGKKIGLVGLGGEGYDTLLYGLNQAKIPVSAVQVVGLSGIGTPEFAALQSGAINALVTDVAGAASLIGKDGIHQLVNFNQPGVLPSYLSGAANGLHANTLMATKTWIDAHPVQVKEFQTAMAEASVWMHQSANFAATEKIESQLTGPTLSASALKYVTQNVIDSVMAVYVDKASMQAQYQLDVNQKVIKPIPNINVADYLAPGCPSSAAAVNTLGAAGA